MGITRFSRLPNPIAFPGYILAPNGGRVFYVDSGGIRDGYTDDIASSLSTSLAAALNQCRPNRGDTIIGMPGHVESVTATGPVFPAGVRIIGVGNGDERPTFNWTLALSQWAITGANVSIENVNMNFAATPATITTKAIVSNAPCTQIKDCRIILGVSATQSTAIGIEFGAGADRFILDTVDMDSTVDAAVVSNVKVVAACDRAIVVGNKWDVGMSAVGNGLFTMTAAPTRLYFGFNSLRNSIAGSTKAFVGIAAATGNLEYNNYYITAAAGGATAAGTFGNLGNVQNFGCASNGSALLCPAVGT